MPRDGAIILADLIGKLDAPYESGPSKAWLKIKSNDNSPRWRDYLR
jgi:ATP-dependent DNA ligase